LLRRRLIQWWRNNAERSLFLAAMAGGAAVLATMDTFVVNAARWEALTFLNTDTALALLCAIFFLQIFASDQPVFWRESSSGINITAFYQARILINSIDLVLQAFIFSAVYFVIRQPHVPFYSFWVPYLLIVYAASGWGYFLSTIVPPRHGPFVTSLVMFIVCGLLGNPQNLDQFLTGGFLEVMASVLSITRWSVAMSFNFNLKHDPPHVTNYMKNATLQFEENVLTRGTWNMSHGEWWTPAIVLIIMGTVLRLFGYIGLRFTNRDKQV